MTDGVATLVMATLLTALFMLCLGGGWRLYAMLRGAKVDDGAATGAGYIVGAALGLLSLLIGFTLALSLDRYEARRRLVADEASAISTVWLRDQLLDQPYRGQLEGLLKTYVKDRRDLPSVGLSRAALDAADQRAAGQQTQIWQVTAAALRTPNDAPLTTAVLQATNQMFDLPSSRRAALEAEVPAPVLLALVLVASIAAAITGYGLRAGGHRHAVASTGLFLAVALIIALIVELDEPRTGLIQVPQAPFERAANAILTAPAN